MEKTKVGKQALKKRELVLEAGRIGIPKGMIDLNMKDEQMRYWMNLWLTYKINQRKRNEAKN